MAKKKYEDEMKESINFDNNYYQENNQEENEVFKTQIEELQKQIEYLKNIIQAQQGTIINQQQYQQDKQEYVVISMFDGILGLKTRPEQKHPAIKLRFKETYTLRSDNELQDFYLANRTAFINRYLVFESPKAAEVLHLQEDTKNQFDIDTYDNLGNLSIEALERVYRSCKPWQKEAILNKFVDESAKGNSSYYNPEKLNLLEKLKNDEIPTILWNEKKQEEEKAYIYNINDKITKTREALVNR